MFTFTKISIVMNEIAKVSIKAPEFISKLYWLPFDVILCWMLTKIWYHWLVNTQLLIKPESIQRPLIHHLRKGLIFANLSPWVKFGLSARCKYPNISSNLFRVSKSDTAQLKTSVASSQYIRRCGSEVYPDFGNIAGKARSSSGVTWNVKFPSLLGYIFDCSQR